MKAVNLDPIQAPAWQVSHHCNQQKVNLHLETRLQIV